MKRCNYSGCRKDLTRKRYKNGKLEPLGHFKNRLHCDNECAIRAKGEYVSISTFFTPDQAERQFRLVKAAWVGQSPRPQ